MSSISASILSESLEVSKTYFSDTKGENDVDNMTPRQSAAIDETFEDNVHDSFQSSNTDDNEGNIDDTNDGDSINQTYTSTPSTKGKFEGIAGTFELQTTEDTNPPPLPKVSSPKKKKAAISPSRQPPHPPQKMGNRAIVEVKEREIIEELTNNNNIQLKVKPNSVDINEVSFASKNTKSFSIPGKEDIIEFTDVNSDAFDEVLISSSLRRKSKKEKSHKKTMSNASSTTSKGAKGVDEETGCHKRPHFQSIIGIPSIRSPMITAESIATMVPQLIDAMVGSLPSDAWDWHSEMQHNSSTEDVSTEYNSSGFTLKEEQDKRFGSSMPASPVFGNAAILTVETVLQQDGRGHVIWNLVETERNYVLQLGVLLKWFRDKMVVDRIIAETASHLIFAGVDELLEFHRIFLAQLEELVAVPNWNTNTTPIGLLFLKHKESLIKIYTYFIDSFAMSQKSIKREEKENLLYVQFMKEAVKLKETSRQQLKDFMILPVQRTARYHLLLKDLIKRTQETHPDYSNLNAAWEAMNILAASVNEKKRQEEQQSGLFDAYELTRNCPPTLIKHSRKLIFTVDVVDQKTSKPFRLFLCSDLLMIASIHGRGVLQFGRNAGEPGYRFVRWLDLLEIRIDESEDIKSLSQPQNRSGPLAIISSVVGELSSTSNKLKPESPVKESLTRSEILVTTTGLGSDSNLPSRSESPTAGHTDIVTPVASISSTITSSPGDHSITQALSTAPVLGKDMVRLIHDPAFRDPTDSYTQPVEASLTIYTFKFDGFKNHKDFCMALQSEIKKNIETRRGGRQIKFNTDNSLNESDISCLTDSV